MSVYHAPPKGEEREPGSLAFPCPVKILDPVTGQRIPGVFWASTSPAKIIRFLLGPDGEPLARATGRKIKGTRKHAEQVDWVASRMPPKLLIPEFVKEYVRLESVEWRPWVAIAVKDGTVIAKSEGAG